MPNNKKKPNLPPVAGERREAGAERRAAAAQLMQDQKRKARRRTVLIQVIVGVVVVLAVIGITLVVLNHDDSGDGGSAGGTPPGLTSDGAVRFGAADAPVTLQAVEDFQCPICKEFEAANGDLLKSYREGDQVAVEYRPIAFLDKMSSTEYSTRALNASMCVLADAGKDAWLEYHQALYANQPEEQSAGLPDSQLESMAADVGATGSGVSSCIEDRAYGDWAAKQTQAAFDDGVTGTPTLFVNGKKIGGFDAATIEKAVKEAGAS